MSRHIAIQTHRFTRDDSGDAGGILRPMPAPANATNVEKIFETVWAFTPETFELVTVVTYELPTVASVPREVNWNGGRAFPKVASPQLEVKIDNTPIKVPT